MQPMVPSGSVGGPWASITPQMDQEVAVVTSRKRKRSASNVEPGPSRLVCANDFSLTHFDEPQSVTFSPVKVDIRKVHLSGTASSSSTPVSSPVYLNPLLQREAVVDVRSPHRQVRIISRPDGIPIRATRGGW